MAPYKSHRQPFGSWTWQMLRQPPGFSLVYNIFLVGGWTNPIEKYARQIGSFPQGSG